jgi:hypothetical protein
VLYTGGGGVGVGCPGKVKTGDTVSNVELS